MNFTTYDPFNSEISVCIIALEVIINRSDDGCSGAGGIHDGDKNDNDDENDDDGGEYAHRL